jgi:tetratricopeptide (TPR) repeat protein
MKHNIVFARFARMAAVLAGLLAMSQPASAFNFVPRDGEWAVWSPLCKARYSVTKAANASPFGNSVPTHEVEAWHAQVGDYTWNHMHHYCAGLAYLHRARGELDAHKRQEFLKSASKEAGYTYSQLLQRPGQPLFSEVSIAMALIEAERGRYSRGIEYLNSALAMSPHDENLFLAMASIRNKEKKPALAKEALLRGDEATGGKSAEINYHLGLVSLDLGEVDAAVDYARKAYAAGYPLPGLKRKLAAAGRTLTL